MALQAILLDVEGTTTPISFVYDKLFPYARALMSAWLAEHYLDSEVQEALAQLADENIADARNGAAPFSLPGGAQLSPSAAAGYCLWLMDRDRKTTPLKTIQGLIWQQGFRRGELQGEVFADVPAGFSEWRRKGCRLAIYSSGSVTAQQLVFEHTPYGNLRPFIDAFFDTRVGPKHEAKSYANIIHALGVEARRTLFISDVPAELDAASRAGLSVALAVRPGNSIQPASANYRVVHSFAGLQL
jgi:enolase-phosphatase E1